MRANEFITEKKKRKVKKPKYAAYGPGPYGWYGYDAGYSGDGGGVEETIRKVKGGYRLVAKSGRNLGTYPSRAGAEKRERQVQYFKHVGEASYSGNIGAMETARFFQIATPKDKKLLKTLIEKGDYKLAWTLIQKVTGVKLKGKEFDTVAEGFKNWLAGAAVGAGLALGSPAEAKIEKVEVSPGHTVFSIAKAFNTTPQVIQKLNKLDKNFTIRPGQVLKVPAGEWTDIITQPSNKTKPQAKQSTKPETTTASKSAEKSKPIKTLTGTPAEAIAKRLALQQGLKGLELAAFLAQIKHESWDFTSMFERGPKSRFEKLYDKKYDPAKAKDLGNTKPGDGVRYRGRGYVQLTGRDNYRRVGRLLGVDLENNPDLAARPDLAAKIALMYWKKRVRPKVKDWSNVEEVTRPINYALNGLESRKEDFAAYVKFYNLGRQI